MRHRRTSCPPPVVAPWSGCPGTPGGGSGPLAPPGPSGAAGGRQFLIRRSLHLKLFFRQGQFRLENQRAGNVFLARRSPRQAVAGGTGWKFGLAMNQGRLEREPRRIIGRIFRGRPTTTHRPPEPVQVVGHPCLCLKANPSTWTAVSTWVTGHYDVARHLGKLGRVGFRDLAAIER